MYKFNIEGEPEKALVVGFVEVVGMSRFVFPS